VRCLTAASQIASIMRITSHLDPCIVCSSMSLADSMCFNLI
jgi:hypothetical protein